MALRTGRHSGVKRTHLRQWSHQDSLCGPFQSKNERQLSPREAGTPVQLSILQKTLAPLLAWNANPTDSALIGSQTRSERTQMRKESEKHICIRLHLMKQYRWSYVRKRTSKRGQFSLLAILSSYLVDESPMVRPVEKQRQN